MQHQDSFMDFSRGPALQCIVAATKPPRDLIQEQSAVQYSLIVILCSAGLSDHEGLQVATQQDMEGDWGWVVKAGGGIMCPMRRRGRAGDGLGHSLTQRMCSRQHAHAMWVSFLLLPLFFSCSSAAWLLLFMSCHQAEIYSDGNQNQKLLH